MEVESPEGGLKWQGTKSSALWAMSKSCIPLLLQLSCRVRLINCFYFVGILKIKAQQNISWNPFFGSLEAYGEFRSKNSDFLFVRKWIMRMTISVNEIFRKKEGTKLD